VVHPYRRPHRHRCRVRRPSLETRTRASPVGNGHQHEEGAERPGQFGGSLTYVGRTIYFPLIYWLAWTYADSAHFEFLNKALLVIRLRARAERVGSPPKPGSAQVAPDQINNQHLPSSPLRAIFYAASGCKLQQPSQSIPIPCCTKILLPPIEIASAFSPLPSPLPAHPLLLQLRPRSRRHLAPVVLLGMSSLITPAAGTVGSCCARIRVFDFCCIGDGDLSRGIPWNAAARDSASRW
jgi:hypothetical protein